ncbi:MAG: hypothetical protein SFW36_06810 [Leptolyngbyaceae cyanobacterium bins.59]|nr:hypothetical protein [Leptolyngbyaceae cyanobacterium bins.59]
MDDWSRDIVKFMEDWAIDVEKFFTDLAKDAAEVVNTFTQLSEEIAESFQSAVLVEIDRSFEEWVEPFLEAFTDLDDGIDPFPYSVPPTLERSPACIGCQNYHGQVYGGTLLICGMHPYGWDGESCPDWEGN